MNSRLQNGPTIVCLIATGVLLAILWPGTALAGNPPANPAAGFFQWRPFLGPFHSVLLHFPIGFVVMAFLVDLYSLRRRSMEAQRIVGLILVFGVLTSVITIVCGLLRSGSAEYDPRMLEVHRNFGIAVGALMLLTLLLHRLAYREEATEGRRILLRSGFRLLLLASIVVTTIAGHGGGNLTHGTNYLTKNAPEFVKHFIEDAPDESVQPVATAANERGRFFVEKVAPIFEAKCHGCHGLEKQKGEYRLDEKLVALKGGESGKIAIKPGDPFESHLVRLILLPPDDDDVMPPSGKRALTAEEVMTIIRWIQQGAPFPDADPPATGNG